MSEQASATAEWARAEGEHVLGLAASLAGSAIGALGNPHPRGAERQYGSIPDRLIRGAGTTPADTELGVL